MTSTAIVVDDHASFRRAATEMLKTVGCQVVGEAATGRDGLTVVSESNPDFVLLDVQLPDIDGFEVLRLLNEGQQPPRVVLVSTRSADDYSSRLAESGAAGFVSKGDLNLELLRQLVRGSS